MSKKLALQSKASSVAILFVSLSTHVVIATAVGTPARHSVSQPRTVTLEERKPSMQPKAATMTT